MTTKEDKRGFPSSDWHDFQAPAKKLSDAEQAKVDRGERAPETELDDSSDECAACGEGKDALVHQDEETRALYEAERRVEKSKADEKK
jgi:hypothetical protein